MSDEPKPLVSRRQMWTAIIIVMVVAAFVMPSDWFSFSGLFDSEKPATDAFSDEVAELDTALREGRPVTGTPATARTRIAQVGVRRLMGAGPMTAEEAQEAVAILEDFETRIAAEGDPGARRSVRKFRDETLVKTFPRLDSQRVPESLLALERQWELASFTAVEDASCEACHTKALAGVEADIVGLWPAVDPTEVPQGLPILMDALEIPEWRERTQAKSTECVDCHTPHDAVGFGVDEATRRENMGVWVNVYRVQDLLYVQVKVKNQNAGHRAPGGYPGHAYALVVDALRGNGPEGERLNYWWGAQLPEHLRTDTSENAGTLFAREMRDASGRWTSQHTRAVTIEHDSRLESDRFVDLTYLFELGEADMSVYVPWWVQVRLIYLPDSEVLEGQDIEVRIRKSDGA